ncbi:hypothetical protein H9L13_11850 [Sphingomonas lutea]|uniref:Uncharacterized protein n=1 Tax=Sphingomonas lutea TaxID=1045317 RepID=A0A7G9SHG0_9SPHN|nr:hypothetical protein [Sphingomonas lutea]QNN67285.1 hypothetical protein H9L13_11850 [Sphingomonas lutea]
MVTIGALAIGRLMSAFGLLNWIMTDLFAASTAMDAFKHAADTIRKDKDGMSS